MSDPERDRTEGEDLPFPAIGRDHDAENDPTLLDLDTACSFCSNYHRTPSVHRDCPCSRHIDGGSGPRPSPCLAAPATLASRSADRAEAEVETFALAMYEANGGDAAFDKQREWFNSDQIGAMQSTARESYRRLARAGFAALASRVPPSGEPDMSSVMLAANQADAQPVTTREAADKVGLHYRQLCVLKPERYEVFLAGPGYSHKLSDALAFYATPPRAGATGEGDVLRDLAQVFDASAKAAEDLGDISDRDCYIVCRNSVLMRLQNAAPARTGEAVAWEVLNAEGTRVSLCGTEDEAKEERREWEMNAESQKPHRVAPLYRAAPPAPAPAVTEEMVEAAAAKSSRDWDALDESLPERDENHENHIAAAESWLNARLAHHLTAALSRGRASENQD